ncbi:MAG: CoB--CoM heterodisulfide reductase iron-sulfur subunit A family protein, partial [Deltaproteobacteria bacterium]|nr:CoB--CoM heterodisulfide reductase iron-sulfur subunit A family protein [Deltaproteobacteria bacterium]
LNLAQQGFGVYLLEKDKVLGGVADRLHRTIEGVDVKAYLDKLIAEVTSHEGIEVLTEARILRHLGSKGSFRTTVVTGSSPAERILQHGAVILATGGGEHRPRGFFYGEDRRVMTQLELGERLRADPHLASSWERVAMIQCVGSRNPENPTCSRICCQSAVKHALELKNRAPQLDVVIFHRDVRTYGLLEDYYTQARDRKVLFERFDPDRAPELVREGEKLKIKFWDAILGRTIQWPVDAVILSAAVEAADTGELARRLGLSQDAQGFFREFHPKLRPVDALMEGYYICGLAHSPRLLKEAVTQGLAAAGRAGAFLADISQKISPLVAHVEQGRCVACLACVRSCPYHIPRINEAGRSEINDSLCLGCGVCATVCPAQAIGFSHYEDEQLRAEISAL